MTMQKKNKTNIQTSLHLYFSGSVPSTVLHGPESSQQNHHKEWMCIQIVK